MDVEVSEQELKLQLRLAQLEKNEACKNEFFNFCKKYVARFYCGSSPSDYC